ncbi:DsrE/DsrF-like family protein [Terriglobus roseus]|uniref:DsrE/DsrF-like family protein n=2 Tax=Terriglobus roseus TaxID=392734 RepID=A0A1H4LTI9_9BACT|nr:DsrE/DsrF-like family protein [Terriglobus roseus]
MSSTERVLHIDIPVLLPEVKAVFSIASLSFEGDLPASMFHLQLIQQDIDAWNAVSELYAVFHTNAGHVTLNDETYNVERKITTGNPYKYLIAGLVQNGVHVELCGATAKAHNWVNADLLPDIRINTDAMARIIQLAQQGFEQIAE